MNKGAGIKDIKAAIDAINQFGEGISSEILGQTKSILKDVDEAFYGSEQIEGIKMYIEAIEKQIATLFSDMEYWTGALQKVYNDVYANQNQSIANQLRNEAAGGGTTVV